MASFSVSRNSVNLTIEPLILCKLCLQECLSRDFFQLSDCKCIFCEHCMRQYVAVLISEGNVANITCPDAACKKQGKLTNKEVEKLLDKQAVLRFKRLLFQREVELDPNRTFCPEVGCDTVCHVDPHSGGSDANTVFSMVAKLVQCPTCGLQFCSICKNKWHAPKSCDEVITNVPPDEIGIPLKNVEGAKIKRCPVCHVHIEWNEGCAQMLCKQCKHCFCWHCLQSLDDDLLLRHYDKGPCKNKLGHSRASVIWHRTKVIGIFAAYGVLLLAASPFLLLATPCILCCKCKMCCDDENMIG